jgi:putative ABC transport system permease protein
MTRPGRAASIVARLVPAERRDAFVDDLAEAVAHRRDTLGRWPARLWYWRQLASSVAPLLALRLRGGLASDTEKMPMTFDTLRQDLRYAFRWLRRSPAFTLASAGTIALGIGASTAIFSVVYALLLKPLPYPRPAELVTVWQDMRARGGPSNEWATPGNLVDWRAESRLFASMASMRGWGPTLTGEGEPEPLRGEAVTPGYFDTLAVPPALGRVFRADETGPAAPRVVVLSDALWRRRFGADRGVLGRQILLSGEPHEIVGVMPPEFRPAFIASADVWRPDRVNLATPSRGAVVLRVVARLQPDVDADAVAAGTARLAADLARQHPAENGDTGITVIPLHEQIVGNVRPALMTVFAAVLFVLLLACVNIANLLLARAAGRSREIAIRAALGAGRRRVIRQLLTESVVLSAIGSAIGVAVSVSATQALVAWAPPGTPRLAEVGLSPIVLAFAAGLTLVTGIVFGLVPAFQLSRGRLTSSLKDSGRGISGGAGQRLRRALIVVEIAVALILLAGSGLFLRSFLALQRADLGFDPANVVAGAVTPPAATYRTEAHRQAFIAQVIERAGTIPGVARAAVASVIPLSAGDSDTNFQVEGMAPAPADREPATWYRLVSDGYFDVMGIKLREGRAFQPFEPAPVVIVNDTLASRYWPGENAVGRRMRFGSDPGSPWFTVVGVVRDVSQGGARSATRLQTFVPYTQVPELAGGVSLVVKTNIAPEQVIRSLKDAVRAIDPDVTVARAAPMSTLVADSIAVPRFLAFIVGAFAIMAVVIAAIGVYGLMSYAVAERRGEIGVRLALGAGSRQIFGLIVGDGLRLAAVGLAIGLAGALALAPMLRALLFGVTAGDPATFALTTAGLIGITAMATMIPARRAMRVDPVATLRE